VATLRHAAAGLPPELREQTLACEDLPALVEAVVSNIDRLDRLNRMQEIAFVHSSLRFTWRERAANLRQAMVSTRHG
jgi:polysaccharide biosynthesis protein PslH